MDDDRLFAAAQAELEHRERQAMVDAARRGDPGTVHSRVSYLAERDGVPDRIVTFEVGAAMIGDVTPDPRDN